MKKHLPIIIGLIGVVLTGLTVYYQIFHKETITLNIERVNSTLLTRPLHIEGLKASYTFHDSIKVKKLWETTFVIRNTGKTTILGEGFSTKNIKDDGLPFRIINCEKLLSATITNCNNSSHLGNRKIYFSQWKQNEYVEITLITEGQKAPYLKISDRDIIDSEITYSEYSPKVIESNQKLIDSVPSGIANFLKWSFVVIVGMMILAVPFGIYDEQKRFKNKPEQTFRVWEQVFIGIMMLITILIFFASPLLWMF